MSLKEHTFLSSKADSSGTLVVIFLSFWIYINPSARSPPIYSIPPTAATTAFISRLSFKFSSKWRVLDSFVHMASPWLTKSPHAALTLDGEESDVAFLAGSCT